VSFRSALTRIRRAIVPDHKWRRFRDPYIELPGSQYAKYLLPLDYRPSRDPRPRWGYSRPPIRKLEQLFAASAPDLRSLLDYLATLPKYTPPVGAFVPFDGYALYGMIKKFRPKRYVEIGSGVTTRIARHAIDEDRIGTRIISIDPEPRADVEGICDEVIRQGLEACSLEVFKTLEPNDIVFMDGSHRSFMNSDVTVFSIDVLPELAPGVIAHIHDVFLPWDYDPYFNDWYWNEQYLIAAYLIGAGARIKPLLPTAYIAKCGLFDMSRFEWLGDSWSGGGSLWFTHVQPGTEIPASTATRS
jgi:hypothetical protein